MKSIKDQKIIITGGTGSFGKQFIKNILKLYPEIPRLVIYSRDELKQWQLQQIYPESKYPQIRFFLGDIRDLERLKRACEGIDTIIHAAALKQVPAAEYNPFEFIKTNVIGAQNIISTAHSSDVSNIIALSTDKAAAPINLYGATKLCSDKLFIAANNDKGSKDKIFSVVRYGNVLGSRGSVVPLFLEKAKSGVIPITSPEMTRFSITLDQGVNMVLWVLENALGGEIFVPKIPSYRINDVCEAIAPSAKKEIIGIRAGEKVHEEMITTSDSFFTIDLGNYYAILPSDMKVHKKYHLNNRNFERLEPGTDYNSEKNEKFLTVEEIRQLIKENINSDFKPV